MITFSGDLLTSLKTTMVSRKKNKGKERKAKKEENKKAEGVVDGKELHAGKTRIIGRLYIVIMGVLLRFQIV